jgi:hypothetical protein
MSAVIKIDRGQNGTLTLVTDDVSSWEVIYGGGRPETIVHMREGKKHYLDGDHSRELTAAVAAWRASVGGRS